MTSRPPAKAGRASTQLGNGYAACPRCCGRLFRDADGRYCIACGFQPVESSTAMAYILAGGAGTRLGVLSEVRAKPALPFGGRHRLIDFTLANCVNSGIEQVTVLAQHNWSSVRRALDIGEELGLRGRLPHRLRLAIARSDAYVGTAGAVQRNLASVRESSDQSVLVLAADHVYSMDYRPLLGQHEATRADLTIAVTPVDPGQAHRFGVAEIRPDGRIRSFVEKPRRPRSSLASMGVYVFTAAVLRRLIEQDGMDPTSEHDFGRDIVPLALREGLKVCGYEFDGYWRDVGTVDAYWAASMDLLQGGGSTISAAWPLPERPEYRGEARLGSDSRVEDALLAGDCHIGGHGQGSVVFPGVRVARGATVVDSVVLPGAVIERGAVVRRAIIDERAVVGAYARVGALLGGISVVGAEARVPAGFTVAASAVIGPGVCDELGGLRSLECETTIKAGGQPQLLAAS